MAGRACERCGGVLPVLARADARYCSARCRQAACRARKQLPKELTGRPQWVRRSARKVPLTASGTPASATDPVTWGRYQDMAALEHGVGLGFVLSSADPIVCIDVDHCIEPGGDLAPWAAELLQAAPATYVEISPSGDGLHIWGTADFLGGRRLVGRGGPIEVYGSGRYITVTSQPYGRAVAELGRLDQLLAALV